MKRILLSLFFITIVSVSTFSQQIANELLKKNSAFAVKLLAGTNGVIYRKGFGYYEKEHGYVLTTYNSIAGFDMVKFIDMNKSIGLYYLLANHYKLSSFAAFKPSHFSLTLSLSGRVANSSR